VALQRAVIDAVESIGAITAAEGIDCDYHRGGTLAVAVTPGQMDRLRAGVADDRLWGLSDDDVRLLDAESVSARVRVGGAVGGVFKRSCARIQPFKLATGLAAAVERKGAVLYEHSPALSVAPGHVACRAGSVRAPWIVVATEGYSGSLPDRRRRLLPMNSSMIVTRPLPAEAWAAIGWEGAETLMDGGHMYAYLQRTADERIAVGGRGVPYRYGSRTARSAVSGAEVPTAAATVAALEGTLRRMFPQVEPSALRAEQAWSGVLGVARDWCPFVRVETGRRGTGGPGRVGGVGGVVSAGGYVGDGVTTSHVAGRTVADLVLGRDSPLTRMPWVDHRARDWEPEPLRWLGVRAVYGLYRAADRSEGRRPDRAEPSAWARVADLLAGRH